MDKDGNSEILDFMNNLQAKIQTSKDARIQYQQITQYIQLLCDHGTRLGENIVKHLEDDIWELRPGNNRVLFFIKKMTIHMSFFIISGKRQEKRLLAK